MTDIQEITENSGETTGNDESGVTDRQFLERLVVQVTMLAADVHELYGYVQGSADVTRKQLDHLDGMVHDVHQFIRLHEPTLDRVLKLFDNPVAKWRASRADVKQGLAPEPAKPCGCGDD